MSVPLKMVSPTERPSAPFPRPLHLLRNSSVPLFFLPRGLAGAVAGRAFAVVAFPAGTGRATFASGAEGGGATGGEADFELAAFVFGTFHVGDEGFAVGAVDLAEALVFHQLDLADGLRREVEGSVG